MKQSERKELKDLAQDRDDIAKIIDDFEVLKKHRSDRTDGKPSEGEKGPDSEKKLSKPTRSGIAGT